jgi:hypothetical protein
MLFAYKYRLQINRRIYARVTVVPSSLVADIQMKVYIFLPH